jgi:hypothetical protein
MISVNLRESAGARLLVILGLFIGDPLPSAAAINACTLSVSAEGYVHMIELYIDELAATSVAEEHRTLKTCTSLARVANARHIPLPQFTSTLQRSIFTSVSTSSTLTSTQRRCLNTLYRLIEKKGWGSIHSLLPLIRSERNPFPSLPLQHKQPQFLFLSPKPKPISLCSSHRIQSAYTSVIRLLSFSFLYLLLFVINKHVIYTYRLFQRPQEHHRRGYHRPLRPYLR